MSLKSAHFHNTFWFGQSCIFFSPLENDCIKNNWPALITTHWAFAPKVKEVKTPFSVYVPRDRFSLTGCYEKHLSPLWESWYLMSLGLQAIFISRLKVVFTICKKKEKKKKDWRV